VARFCNRQRCLIDAAVLNLTNVKSVGEGVLEYK
jgi:hypothetical protein